MSFSFSALSVFIESQEGLAVCKIFHSSEVHLGFSREISEFGLTWKVCSEYRKYAY